MIFSRKRFFITLLVLLTACAGLFAQSIVEKNAEVVEFSTLDLESAKLTTIMKSFDAEAAAYNANYETIYNRMYEAYRKGNAVEYYEAKGLMSNLKAPSLTRDMTKALVARIQDEKDEQLKAEFAAWLYAKSRYYRPTITISASAEYTSKLFGTSHFSYRYSLSSEPGKVVTLPKVPTSIEGKGTFRGWGLSADEVLYEAGSEVVMPYVDQTLYAVYN